MVKLSTAENYLSNLIGPLLDDGAPYSGMGFDDFKTIQPYVLPSWSGKLDPIPPKIASRPFWQYGTGAHSSETRSIIGSVLLSVCSDQGAEVQIRHLIISGSSQWFIGRNITSHCDIVHTDGNILRLPNRDDNVEFFSISLIDSDMHTYIPHEIFVSKKTSSLPATTKAMFCATATIDTPETNMPQAKTKTIVDRVHQHVCGHSNFSDMRTLLQRNGIWNRSIEDYLINVLDTCTSCKVMALPKKHAKFL